MQARELSVHIDTPPEAVFQYVTDVKRHPEWAAQNMEIQVDGEPVAAGTTFSSTVKFMGNVKGKGKVVEMQAPSRFSYECQDSSGLWRWTMQLAPDGGGTRLTQSREMLSAPFYMKAMEATYMWPVFGKKMVNTGLQNIKRNLEAAAKTAS